MNLSEFGYRYKPVVLLLTVFLMAYGVFSYFTLPAREDPAITIREAIISCSYPGLPAERVETLVTKPIEEAVLTVRGIEEIRSTSLDGQAIVYAKAYDYLSDLDQIWDEVEEAVQSSKYRLPSEANTPTVNDNFGDVAVITLALTGDDYSMAELFDFAQHSRETLNSVQGTREVSIVGAVQERIYVEASNAKLAEFGIPPSTLVSAIQERNTVVPGGLVDTGERAFALVPTGDFQSVDEVSNLLIRIPSDGSLIALRDIAKVSRGYADPAPQRAYFNGRDAIVLSIVIQPEQSVLNYSKRARVAIDDLRESLPAGLSLDVITWQAEQVEGAVYGVSINVAQTLIIVLAVVMLFLGIRTGLIVGSIVPAVMLSTLAVMGVLGITLERMSLATLVIGLGLLVDNGVVIAENFKRLLASHGDRDLALRDTGKELAIPLLSSSLTTILVFLPLMLAKHGSGEYTRNISLVILISLMSSWLLAMMVTPTLCHRFMKVPKGGNHSDAFSTGYFGKIERFYGHLLRVIIKRKIIFLVLMFALLPFGGLLIATAPARFFPDSDRSQVLIYVNLPAGVTTSTTQVKMQSMMEIISNEESFPELGDFAAYVGFGGPRFVLSLAPIDQSSHVGFFVINATDQKSMIEAIPRLRAAFRTQLPEVDARVSAMFLGPSDPNVIQVQIKGPDSQYIQHMASEIEQWMTEVPGSIDVWSNWYNPVSRIRLEIDHTKAQRANITSEDVAQSLATFSQGRSVSQYRDTDEVFPIVTRAIAAEREEIGRLQSVAVYPTGSSDSVPLGQIAAISTEHGNSVIQREDLIRTVTIESRNLLMSPEDMAPILQPRIDQMNRTLAPGHVVEFDGIVKDSKVGKLALLSNFPLCLGLAVLLLVGQFNGYRRPLIVILTIPLVIVGVGLGLRVMQAEFSFLVILGIFALAGIIVNNAIVLIDRIDIERSAKDCSDSDAVVSASTRRLRPILMTTVTTIVGLLPLIIGQDVLFYGMASIMAFGLTIGTILTLGVAPALYCLFFGISPEAGKTPVVVDKKECSA